MQLRQVICALDTGDLDFALSTVRRLSPNVGAFKVGHALTLPHGLDVLSQLQAAGAERIFLDLKFHDIPNSVALGVQEAAKRGVWMLTVHTSGGTEMMRLAAEAKGPSGPLVVGVTVLTSIDRATLNQELHVAGPVEDHAIRMAELAASSGLDGVVCSPHEIRSIRNAVGKERLIVTPGIRVPSGESHDQKRTGTAAQALADGADYLVIGRALSESQDLDLALTQLGFESPTPAL